MCLCILIRSGIWYLLLCYILYVIVIHGPSLYFLTQPPSNLSSYLLISYSHIVTEKKKLMHLFAKQAMGAVPPRRSWAVLFSREVCSWWMRRRTLIQRCTGKGREKRLRPKSTCLCWLGLVLFGYTMVIMSLLSIGALDSPGLLPPYSTTPLA